MKVNVRCRNCKSRRVLTKHPLSYDRLPKCNNCGEQNYRVVIREKQITCNCSGYWFPHRQGSHMNCSLKPINDFMEGLEDKQKPSN